MRSWCAGPGTGQALEEGGKEPEGPTMMGRQARDLMLSGQGAAGLELFKVRSHVSLVVCLEL